MKTAEEYLKESGYEEGMTWTLEGMKLNMGIFAYEYDQEIKDMIEGVFDDYEYDDEHYTITPHILKLQELIRSKL